MGILFNRKTAGGAIINKKYLADKDIHNKDIRELSRNIGIYKSAGQHEFKKMLMRDQRGGLTRDELHKDLQELIGKKYITSTSQARKIATELGLKGKRFLRFDKLSKYTQKQKIAEAQNSKKPDEKIQQNPNIYKAFHSAPNHPSESVHPMTEKFQFKSFQNPTMSANKSADNISKPKNIWEILNKSKISRADDQNNKAA